MTDYLLSREVSRLNGEPQYAFCETATAGPRTPWHIRKLGAKGLKLGGGADTPSLCGRTVAWDLKVEITEHHLEHNCRKCAEAYRAR